MVAGVPPENPIARIERVARDLGSLAEDLEDYAGPEAQQALLHWRAVLLAAVEDLERAGAERGG
jgi:hypothetical protein